VPDSLRLLLVRLWSDDGDVDCGFWSGGVDCGVDCADTAAAKAAENTIPNMKSRLIKYLPR